MVIHHHHYHLHQVSQFPQNKALSLSQNISGEELHNYYHYYHSLLLLSILLLLLFPRRWIQYQRRRTPQSYSRCLSISSEAYWVARWDNFLLLHSNRNCICILTFVSPSRLMWSKMWYSRKRMCDSKTKTDDFICFPAHRWSSKTRSDSTVTKTDDQSWKSDNNRFVRLQHLFLCWKPYTLIHFRWVILSFFIARLKFFFFITNEFKVNLRKIFLSIKLSQKCQW